MLEQCQTVSFLLEYSSVGHPSKVTKTKFVVTKEGVMFTRVPHCTVCLSPAVPSAMVVSMAM